MYRGGREIVSEIPYLETQMNDRFISLYKIGIAKKLGIIPKKKKVIPSYYGNLSELLETMPDKMNMMHSDIERRLEGGRKVSLSNKRKRSFVHENFYRDIVKYDKSLRRENNQKANKQIRLLDDKNFVTQFLSDIGLSSLSDSYETWRVRRYVRKQREKRIKNEWKIRRETSKHIPWRVKFNKSKAWVSPTYVRRYGY